MKTRLGLLVALLSTLSGPASGADLSKADALNLFQLVDDVYTGVDKVWPKEGVPAYLRKVEAACLGLEASGTPLGIQAEDWTRLEIRTQRALGWVRMQLRDPSAEQELAKALTMNPEDAEISYWLGSVLATKHNWSMAAYHLARAASLPDSVSLPAYGQAAILSFTRQIYQAHGGPVGGFERLVELSKASAIPPEDFDLTSLR